MQSTRSALRLGCPVRFRDRWQGRLVALEIDDRWFVLNLVLSRGIFRSLNVRLPFSVASRWDDQSLFMDCTSDEAFGRKIPPAAVPPRPLSARTPLSARGTKLTGALVDTTSRRISHLLLSWGLFAPRRRMAPVRDVTLDGGAITLAVQADALAVYRPDSELAEAVRGALAGHPYLTADDRRALNVAVVDGTAHLSGNVRTPQARAFVHAAAAPVPGITAVIDTVVDDHKLEIAVARALHASRLFRYGRIYVRSSLGDVTLGGLVTTEAAIPGIANAASAVPGVRSVATTIEVQGRPPPATTPPGAAATGSDATRT